MGREGKEGAKGKGTGGKGREGKRLLPNDDHTLQFLGNQNESRLQSHLRGTLKC